MAKILVYGAGKSATVLIHHLLKHASAENYTIIVVDTDLALAREKTRGSGHAQALSFDILQETKRRETIRMADLVISMLPPTLHSLVARDCIREKKHLLTASYVDDEIRAWAGEISNQDLLFLCEMGLDPGMDHMSAMRLIDGIRASGGNINSFRSHCGGLVAPDSDDNPWHYKISWNPRNVVMAGKNGAVYKLNDTRHQESYHEIFSAERVVSFDKAGDWAWYPNRDSLQYIPVYGLQKAHTFIRTTLRHPDFIRGWNNLVELNLTEEEKKYQTDGLSLLGFFRQHMDQHGFGDWLNRKLADRFSHTREMLENLAELVKAEEKAGDAGEPIPDDIMTVDEKGSLSRLNLESVKGGAAASIAEQLRRSNLILKQLFFLGMDDSETLIDKGLCSAADVLQFALEQKLALRNGDKDMILMLHEIEYLQDGRLFEARSSLQVLGEDNQRTAMAKTVGLPLGIAARLILKSEIPLRGLHIPVHPAIYKPVLAELEREGLVFREKTLPR